MSSTSSSIEKGSPELRKWLYRNAATLLLTIVIALSGFVGRQIVTSLDRMRSDIRDLTRKVGEVVTNQNVQRQMIDRNAQDIREIKQVLGEHEDNWQSQWRSDNSSNE